MDNCFYCLGCKKHRPLPVAGWTMSHKPRCAACLDKVKKAKTGEGKISEAKRLSFGRSTARGYLMGHLPIPKSQL